MAEFDFDLVKKLKNFKDYCLYACDEVGRGPLAGPVVGACTALDLNQFKNLDELKIWINRLRELGINDSKKISLKKRNILKQFILQTIILEPQKVIELNLYGIKLRFCLTEIDHHEIDQINILNASLKAMCFSFEKLHIINHNSLVLIDGNRYFQTELADQILTVIKGDQKSVMIGLSSILAKVYRDELMEHFHLKYPEYSFAKNAGYPSLVHREAIKRIGPCPIHRKTFKGVKEYVKQNSKGKSI